MARYNDKTDVQRQQLESFSKALREIAAMIDGDVATMTQNDMDRVSATHGKTREEAVDGLVKFCAAVHSAIAEALVVSPFQQAESQQKTTSRASKATQTAQKKPQ